MECPHCGENWILTEYEIKHIEYPDKCPFCGNSTNGFSSNSAMLLKQLIEKNGISLLQNKKMLTGYISDLLAHNPRELKTLKIVISEDVAMDFVAMLNVDEAEKNRVKHKIFKFITEDIGLADDRAEFVINTFMYALSIEEESKFLGTEKTYADANNAYYLLARNYIDCKELKNAYEALVISADAGNIDAIEKIKEVISWQVCKPEIEKWFAWNLTYLDKKGSPEAAYIVAMCISNGLGTRMDTSDNDYWIEGKKYNAESATEYVARQIIGLLRVINIRRSIQEMIRFAREGFKPALGIIEILNDAGLEKWKDCINGDIPYDEYTYDEDYFNEQKTKIAMLMAEYHYANYIENDKYSVLQDSEKVVLVWYSIALKFADREHGLELCKKFLASNSIRLKYSGLKALEDLDDELDGNYIVGLEYLKGDIVVQDYDKAYEIFINSYSDKATYYEARMNFFGWGNRASLETTIKSLENELANYIRGYSPLNSNDEYGMALTIPLLIQCYYEDLILTDSVSSLEKLQTYADYCKWPTALLYLYWYYSDRTNFYRDPVEAEKYRTLLEQVKNKVPVYKGKKYFRIRNRVAYACKNIDKSYKKGNLFNVRDFSIFCEDITESNGDSWNEKKIDTFFYLACAFALGNGVKTNYLRSEIYLRRYFYAKGSNVSEDDENYIMALRLKSLLLVENKGYNFENLSVKLLRSRTEHIEGVTVDREQIKYYLEREKSSNADLIYDGEAAINCGYKGEHYALIGFAYLQGTGIPEANPYKGFSILKNYYDDYLKFNCELKISDGNISTVEFRLAVCYLTGEGTYPNESVGVDLLKKSIDHADKECKENILLISMGFFNGKFDFKDKEVIVPRDYMIAFKGLRKAADYGISGAKLMLGKYYQYGIEPVEQDYERALDLYLEGDGIDDYMIKDAIADLPVELTVGNKYGWQYEENKVLIRCGECKRPFYYKYYSRFDEGENIRCPLCGVEIRAKKFNRWRC